MKYLLKYSIDKLETLRHFYDVQQKYITKKAKQGMKENRIGFLIDFYFNVMANGSQEEKEHITFLNLKKFVERYITIQTITEKSVIYEIKDRSVFPHSSVTKTAKEYQKYAEMPVIHGNNTLIMLITRFEEFVSDFIKIIYGKFPEKYLDSQTIAFSEITQNGIEEIKEKIILRKVDAFMRGRYADWFKLFEEHNMKFVDCQNEYEILRELYARRNIIVHNSGKVNDEYIKNIPNTRYKSGERLYADADYLDRAFEAIKTIIYCILIEGVRLEKDKQDEYINYIFETVFNELVLENYSVCETVFWALQKNAYADEVTKHMAQINYWIAKIEKNDIDSVKEDIAKWDISALDKTFRVAKHILLQEYEEATAIVEEMYSKKEISVYELEGWPLFKTYRKTREYNGFKYRHPELSSIVVSETKPENPMEDNETTQSVRSELKESDISESGE